MVYTSRPMVFWNKRRTNTKRKEETNCDSAEVRVTCYESKFHFVCPDPRDTYRVGCLEGLDLLKIQYCMTNKELNDTKKL